MPDELNTSSHRYYQRQNNYLLTRDSFSRDVISDAATLSFDTATAARLFSVPGSRGFFYDFSDYSTMFGDTAGTTPVTGVGQSVGLVLDESRGLVRGPELATVTSVTGVAIGGPAFTNYIVTPTLTVNTTYEISFTVSGYSGSGDVGVAASGSRFSPAVGTAVISGNGVVRFIGINVTASALSLYTRSTNTANFSNISVRELPGNHATQATAGSRALTQVRPMFTQRNRAVGSELVENATYWLASQTVNGVTYTRVATGIDTDGLPYADYSAVGTATALSEVFPYVPTNSRISAAVGNQITVSFLARVISGTPPTGGSGARADVVGETAPNTFTEIGASAVFSSTTEGTVALAYTLANAASNQARGQITLRTLSGQSVNYTIRLKAFQFELGSARTTYQPAVSGELRNRAIGSGDVGNATYWPASVVSNGITATKVASGIDTDGLPYVDVRYTGTATDTFHGIAYADQFSRGPATVGQSWTASLTARVLSGSLTNVNGIDARTVEETAPFTFVGQAMGNQVTASVDTRSVSTRVIASGNQVRLAVVLTVINGATIDITYRIKGLQLELGPTYSRYQRVVTANEWYEPGFTSYRGLRFDGVDDFLQTAAIDFAGAGISGSNILTGSWTLTVDGGTATATESPAGTLNLTGDGANGANARQAVTTEIGKRYRVDCTVGSSAMSIFIGTASGGADVLPFTTVNTGVNCVYFTATTTTSHIAFRKAGAALSTTSGITVREAIVSADKMTVVAGVRKLSDAGNGTVVEFTAAAEANNGTIFIRAPSGGLPNYQFWSRGTADSFPAASGFASPISNVLTCLGDISGDSAIIRANGAQVVQSSADQGTGTYGNHPVFIGRRGGTTLPFNGVLTFLCVINRTLTADDLALLETIANSRTGAY